MTRLPPPDRKFPLDLASLPALEVETDGKEAHEDLVCPL